MVEEGWGAGTKHLENLEERLFHVRKMPFLNRQDTEKGHSRSFAEKGRGLDPSRPPAPLP